MRYIRNKRETGPREATVKQIRVLEPSLNIQTTIHLSPKAIHSTVNDSKCVIYGTKEKPDLENRSKVKQIRVLN